MCSGPTDASLAAFCQCLLISVLQLPHQLNEEISNPEAFESQTLVRLAVIANFRDVVFVTVQDAAVVSPWLPGDFRRHGLSLEIPLESPTKRNLLTRGEVTHGDIRDRLLRSTLSNYFYRMPHRQP